MIHIRVFIAIEFEEKMKAYLWDKRNEIKQNSIKGNFTKKDNLHLTLKFIGDVEIDQLETLKRIIDEVGVKHEPFTLLFKKVGRFQRGKKSIVWVGLKKNTALEELHRDLENCLEKQGYSKEERGFSPHITLGREVLFQCDFEELQQIVEIRADEIFVNKVTLMESTRINGELKYIPIYWKSFQE